MAVNINTVYTTVLFILNKEQRGYVTPIEFNSISTQVQEEIFASYFPDGNQLNRFNQNNQQNDTEFFNMFKGNAYKLYPFEQETAFTLDVPTQSFYYAGARTVYKIGEIISTYTGNPTRNSITQLTSKSDFSTITRSRLTSPTSQYPIAHNTHAIVVTTPATPARLVVNISPVPNSVSINCLFRPTNPVWGFDVGTLGQYTFNATASTNFELDVSEQTSFILKTLFYFGVVVKDPQIIQVAANQIQQEEVNKKS